MPVMSEKAVLLRTTARKEGPSPGPTSLSDGNVEAVDPAAAFDKLPEEDVAMLSAQLASTNPLLSLVFCCEDWSVCCPVLDCMGSRPIVSSTTNSWVFLSSSL